MHSNYPMVLRKPRVYAFPLPAARTSLSSGNPLRRIKKGPVYGNERDDVGAKWIDFFRTAAIHLR